MKILILLASVVLVSCATPSKVVVKADLSQASETSNDTRKLAIELPPKEVPVVVVEEKVYNYGANSSELRFEDKKELKALVQEIVSNPDRFNRIEIVGHSDQTGTEDLNLDISKERAVSILEMMRSMGVEKKKVRTSWLAGTEPLEKTAKDSNVNRRVEIRVYKLKSQF